MQFIPQRLDRVHRTMRHENVDVLIVTRPSNVQYLTGYNPPSDEIPVACVISDEKQPTLILSEQQAEGLQQNMILGNIATFHQREFNDWNFPQGSDFWPRITDVLKDLGLTNKMIGLEHNWLSIKEFDTLKSLLPDAGFVDFSEHLWRLRMIKDTSEIEAIRQAVKIAEIGIRTALEKVDVGQSEIELSLEIESAMRVAGGELRGIRAAVIGSERGHLSYAQPGPTRLARSSSVIIDVSVRFAGYFAELTRTVHLGPPSLPYQKFFNEFALAMKGIEGILKPGIELKTITLTFLAQMRKRAHCIVFLPLGSSIGLDLHEPPFIDSSSTSAFRENVVFSFRPVCSLPNIGIIKMADIFLITSDGCENLSSLARETL